LETVKLDPLGTDSWQETLVLEATIDILPCHSPRVARRLKVYLSHDLRGKSPELSRRGTSRDAGNWWHATYVAGRPPSSARLSTWHPGRV
jgi:hypothetical protein